MTRALELLAAYGVGVRFADLGDWGDAELRAEYDPAIPEIRLNVRVAARLNAGGLDVFIASAAGHELYHHLEAIGEIDVLAERSAREAAADEYSAELRNGSK